MTPVQSAGEVLDAMQRVKSGATAFCTNFFPVQPKLESWIAHKELIFQTFDGAVFFLRKDRDFAHLYFCANSPATFGQRLPELLADAGTKLSTDLVGQENSLVEVLKWTEQAGFSQYSRLVRLARVAAALPPADSAADVALARAGDAPATLSLIEMSFDRFADQLPTLYEIEAAIAAGQIITIKQNNEIAALLYFETQGMTSTIRYWLVASQFHSRGFGSALIRYYLSSQTAVRRFILWVSATNENAIQKYKHYGYTPDGLLDHVLVREAKAN